MLGIYNYILERKHASKAYSFAAVVMLVPTLNAL